MINDQPKESNQLESAGLSDDMQLDATPDDKAGEGTRTLNIQLGRLTLYQLSYARVLPGHCSTASSCAAKVYFLNGFSVHGGTYAPSVRVRDIRFNTWYIFYVSCRSNRIAVRWLVAMLYGLNRP